MSVAPPSLVPSAAVPARAATQVATSTPTASPVPTTSLPDSTGGLGLAALLVGLFFVVAVAVTLGGTLVAGWAVLRGRFLWLEVGPWQRRVLAVAAAGLVLSLSGLLLGGARLGAVAIVSFGVGAVALVVGVGWVVGADLRDRLHGRG